MSLYDNEIYRGAAESDPTLAKDTSRYEAEFYIVKPPETTVQQDMPPTEEPVPQERKPAVKKKRRTVKAMKLLASCVTAVAVMTALAVPKEPEPELPLWPQFLPAAYAYTYDPVSQNSVDCQVGNDHKSYLLTAQQEGIYLTWTGGFYTYFNVTMTIPAKDWDVYLNFDTDRASMEATHTEYLDMYQEDLPDFGLGQIRTVSGETLYVLGMLWNDQLEGEIPPVQQIIDHLDEYIQISDATTADGWDKLLIGDTMYTQTNPRWSGTKGAPIDNNYNLWYELEAVYPLANADCSEDNLICRRQVNGIDWSFYYGDRSIASQFINRVIWAVPAQEDIALGYDSIVGGIYLELLEGFYVDDVTAWAQEIYGDNRWVVDYILNNDTSWEAKAYGCEPSATWSELLEAIVDSTIVKYIVSQIYPVDLLMEPNPVPVPDAPITNPPEDPTAPTAETVTEPLSQCEASGHSWLDANYQAPQTCSVCGKTQGYALRPAFETHGLKINITELGEEYDYLTSSADGPSYKTWGKLSISNYRIFEGNEDCPALEGYEWHAVSVKIRFYDNIAFYRGMSLDNSIENYYDIDGWDASQTYLEEEDMIQYTCSINGIDYTQCLYYDTKTVWSGWTNNPETGISECSATFNQYIRVPVGYDGAVFGYYDAGIDWTWGDGQHVYDIADDYILFFRLDGTGAQ